MENNNKKNILLSRRVIEMRYQIPVRHLEECVRKTKLTGQMVGPYFIRFGNTYRYKPEDVEAYINKNRVTDQNAQDLEEKMEKDKKICKLYNKKKIQIKNTTNSTINHSKKKILLKF
tara:strand:- start:3544 stop:3894 length:351 start_codon:yes stop_codon:yes gene_type:complete